MSNHSAIQEQSMLEEVIQGLQKPQKELSSKFFYDERGSRLFEKITQLQEYYPTRTEISILEKHIEEITGQIGDKAVMIELGSGSSRKTRLLLDKLESLVSYIPVDISEEYLQQVAEQLRQDYPQVLVKPVCADYTSRFEIPDLAPDYKNQVLFFPGSTIGNFSPKEANNFLNNLESLTDDNASLLIGVDLRKDRSVLEAAYNDQKGVTAEFNKNILMRLNKELSADFDLSTFRHNAFFNEQESRIEMHLVSKRDQTVTICGQEFYFEEGESIHTENSYKYSIERFRDLVGDSFSIDQIWTDENRYFSVQFLRKK